jgi:flagellar hook-associated protein 3 FlgL
MQIGTSQFYQSQINSMTDMQTSIGQTQEQISSGKQIQLPSDNPVDYSKIQTLKLAASNLTQYKKNISVAQQSLNLESTALNQFSTLLTRLKELSIQGQNDTNNPADRQAIAAEMSQISDQIQSLGNSTDSNGDYIFGGTRSGTQPFTSEPNGGIQYNGDDGRRNVTIGTGLSTPISSNGQEVFMMIPSTTSGGSVKSIYSIINKAISDLKSGNSPTDSGSDLQAAIDHVSVYQTINGARMNKVNNTQSNIETELTDNQSEQSTLADTDVAAAATKLTQQSLDLSASQAAFAKITQLSLFNYLK